MHQKPLRRAAAAAYLQEQGIPITPNGLAKAAVRGDGPAMVYFNRTPLYTTAALEEWIAARLTPPITSTAEAAAHRGARGR